MASTINAKNTSTGVVITPDSSGQLELQTADTTRMTIDVNGNVGVGTGSPAYKLDVAGNVYIPVTNSYYCFSENFGMGTPDSSGLQIFTGSINAIRFGNRSSGTFTERMRIDSSGNVLVGTTTTLSPTATSGTGMQYSPSLTNFVLSSNGNEGFSYNATTYTSGTVYPVVFRGAGVVKGYISFNGSTTSYVTSSDYRLKENIAPMTGALDVVAQLKPVTYTWKADGSDGQGFIAHELQAVVPDAVTGEKDAVNEDGSIKPQGIDTSFLVATLTASIQELKAIIDTQAERIAVLENK